MTIELDSFEKKKSLFFFFAARWCSSGIYHKLGYANQINFDQPGMFLEFINPDQPARLLLSTTNNQHQTSRPTIQLVPK